MNYENKGRKFEGKIVKLGDGLVGVDIAGRLGYLEVPIRMVMSENSLEVGNKVSLKMSYLEVIDKEKEKSHVLKLNKF